MRSAKFGLLFLLTLILFPLQIRAAELQGYQPPPMFGVVPQPKTSSDEPAPAPPPAAAKEAPKTLSAEDLLNHPATGGDAPAMPSIDSSSMAAPASPVEDALPLPGSVAPKPKTTKTPPAKKEAPKKVEPKKTEPKKAEPVKAPVKKEIKKEPKKTAAKPVVIPAEKPAAKAPAKPSAPKEAPKKVEPVKPAAPATVKKPEPKPVVKTAPKESPKKTQPVKPEPVKPEPAKTEQPKSVPAAPVPALPPEPAKAAPLLPMPDLPVPDKKAKPFHLDGKKNMPTAVPAKVETLKSPLPEINTPAVTIPTPNEQIIDKALQDRLVEPDPKSIVDPKKPVAAEDAAKNDSKIFKPEMISLEFKPDVTDLQDDQKRIVDAEILPKLLKNKTSRMQILAYASPSKEGQSGGRRVSLSRGLSLRSYLLEKGIEPARMDIRALGENTNEKPLDRVDLLILNIK